MESKPPSVVIQEARNQAQSINHVLTEQEIVELARKTLLSVNEVSMWLDHLAGVAERRKEGAKKAAATRKKVIHLQIIQTRVSEKEVFLLIIILIRSYINL